MHTHCLPGPLVEALRRRTSPPDISDPPGEAPTLGIHGSRIPYSHHFVDMAARLELMDRHGIEVELLSLPGLFGIDSLPAPDALPLCHLFNNGVAEIVSAHPGRFAALASVPVADPEMAAVEYRRARSELGLSGVILPGDTFVSVEQAQPMAPILDAVAEVGGMVFVHPGPLPTTDRQSRTPEAHTDSALARRVTVDIQNRMSHVMVTLALTDFLDPWPDIPVQVANLGGSMPLMLERMDLVTSVRRPGEPLPSASMRPLHVDCSTMGPVAIEAAVATYGPDHMVMGTDTPVFGERRPWTALEAADLPTETKNRIARENAADLLASVA